MNALGKKPELRWVDKRLLTVDHSYQRTLEGKRSQQLVDKIAANFSWVRCGTLVVTNDHMVIDGQHRLAAAMRRSDIKDLPCSMLDISRSDEQARIFIDINRERVALTHFAIMKAAIAASDPEALGVMKACESAGVKLLGYPVRASDMKPRETIAIITLRDIYRQRGAEHLTAVLKVLAEAYPDRPGQMIYQMITAVSLVLCGGAPAEKIVATLKRTDARSLQVKALLMRQENPSLKANEVFRAMIEGGEVPSAQTIQAKAPTQPKSGPKKKPFQFDRSKSAPPQAKPAEVRGNVQVRRFEPGASGLGSDDFLKRCGYEVSKRPNGYDVKKAGAPGKPKRMTHAQVIELLNHERKKRGLQPATKVDAA